jgi:hypothetical protein
MATLSITTAWNETVDLVRREAALLFPVSFLLLSLPGALMEAAAPQPGANGQPQVSGIWLLLFLVAMVAGFIGNIAISYLALRSGVSVAEALRRGLSRMPSLLGATVLVGIAFLFLFFVAAVVAVLIVPGAMSAAESGATTVPALIGAVLVAIAIVLPFGVYFAARLMLMTPIAAVDPGNPFELIGRSWRLTAGHVWKLIGFLILIGVLILVLRLAIGAVAGILFALIAGQIEPGSTSHWLVIVVMALVNMVVAAYFTSLIARIYAQLAGDAETHRIFA